MVGGKQANHCSRERLIVALGSCWSAAPAAPPNLHLQAFKHGHDTLPLGSLGTSENMDGQRQGAVLGARWRYQATPDVIHVL